MIADHYLWEMETLDGTVLRQLNELGYDGNWMELPLDKIVRVSFLPMGVELPRHDILIDIERGGRFVRRFGRGFMKSLLGTYQLAEYANCVETNFYRIWVFHSSGRVLITRPDYEVYV